MILAFRSFSVRHIAIGTTVSFALLLFATDAAAQGSRVGATLEGIVRDTSGAVIPNSKVTLCNPSTNQSRTVTTDGQGFFRAHQLSAGTYDVQVEQMGFTPYRQTGVGANLGQTVHLDIVLATASASEQLTVSAEPSALDPSQSSVVSSIDQERIEELPVRSRNYLDFVLLAPGVSSSPVASGPSASTPLTGSGFTFGGLRSRSNNVSIDGLDNNDEYTGSSRTELSPEIVQEFQVVSNGLSAESGGASGGSINVITRSGTNIVHGDAFLFAQDGTFNARDPFETESGKPSFRRFRAGFSLSGPIVKDKTFYYAAIEQEHIRDFERLPAGFNQDTDNVSPRIGVAWSPSPNWVFRAGYGIFFDRYVLANSTRAIEKNGLQAFEQVADANVAASIFATAQGGPRVEPVFGIAPSIFRSDPRIATPYSQQASAGVEYLLTKNLTLRADYSFVRGVKLPRTLNVNLLPPVILTLANAVSLGVPNPTPQQIGREVFVPGRLDTQFGDIYQVQDSAGSTYNGASVTLTRRMNNELEFSASYTLSKTFDNASDFDDQPQNPFNLRAENAVSRQHQQQRFGFNALWDLPIGAEEDKGKKGNAAWLTQTFSHIEVAPIVTLESGRPVNPLTGLDSNQSHAFPLSARPLPGKRLAEHTCTGDDGRPRSEVLPIRGSKTSRRGSGVVQFVQQCECVPDQSCIRLKPNADGGISATDCRNRRPPSSVVFGFRILRNDRNDRHEDCGFRENSKGAS